MNDDTNVYINSLGFSVEYPKFNLVPSNCEELKSDKAGKIPLKVIDLTGEKKLYISGEKVIKIGKKELNNGFYTSDFSNCEVINNSLELILNGYDNGMSEVEGTENNIVRPSFVRIKYKYIENDLELNELADSMFKGCYAGEKTKTDQDSQILNITLTEKNGERGGPGSSCFTNFKYYFLYSKKNKLAVITSGYQAPPFNGSNGQSEPVIKFN